MMWYIMSKGGIALLYVLLIPVVIVVLYFAYKTLKKIIKEVIKEIKEYKESSESEQALKELVFIVIIFPILMYIFDRYDVFSLLKITDGISINYDWLSFMGTYIGTIISALFLIYITRMDRKDNNENVREAQRPNLCTKVYSPNNRWKKNSSTEDSIIQNENNTLECLNRFFIKISNSGQTVAILDMNKSYFRAHIIVEENVKKDNSFQMEYRLKEVVTFFNEYEDRLHINSNREVNLIVKDTGMYINCPDVGIPKIEEVYIEYKDLFGKRYIDHIRIEADKIIVLEDNKLMQ